MWYYVGVIYLLSPCLYFIHPFSPRFSEMRKNGRRKSNPSGYMALAVSWIEIVNSESFGFRVGILQLSSPQPILMCNGLITVMTWWMDHTSQVTKALFPGKGILPRGVRGQEKFLRENTKACQRLVAGCTGQAKLNMKLALIPFLPCCTSKFNSFQRRLC